jgi:peptidylprolyl isomerase
MQPAILETKVLTPGSGADHPTADSIVTVTYELRGEDGILIDSSASRGGVPTTWNLKTVMRGLREGIQQMVSGEIRRITVPPGLAYENRGGRPSGTLIFDVHLLAIAPPREAPSVDEFKAPPTDAVRTANGVALKVLRAGSGAERPKPLSTVRIQYSGWTEGGLLFDDGVGRGAPLTVNVDEVMPGLSEGLQRMAVGEKSRMWIPAALAYEPPGPPRTALVFDVELIEIAKEASGVPGAITVQTNSDVGYTLVRPDGTPEVTKEPKTFAGMPPGQYRIKPNPVRAYATGIAAVPREMTLAPGGTLTITITYKPILA